MISPSKSPCKVVTQYQSGGERVYELEAAGNPLEIRISSRAVGGGERWWHVAVQLGAGADSPTLAEEAETKRGALDKVAEQWTERAAELGLPAFDWSAVASALLAVRGI